MRYAWAAGYLHAAHFFLTRGKERLPPPQVPARRPFGGEIKHDFAKNPRYLSSKRLLSARGIHPGYHDPARIDCSVTLGQDGSVPDGFGHHFLPARPLQIGAGN